MNGVTQILSQIEQGDPHAADQLLPLVYEELRKLAAARLADEKPGQTLQATALVHDAYIRLVDVKQAQHWNSRAHFFGAAAEAMRRILVDRARRKRRPMHGGDRQRVELDDACAADRDQAGRSPGGRRSAARSWQRNRPRKQSWSNSATLPGCRWSRRQSPWASPGPRPVATGLTPKCFCTVPWKMGIKIEEARTCPGANPCQDESWPTRRFTKSCHNREVLFDNPRHSTVDGTYHERAFRWNLNTIQSTRSFVRPLKSRQPTSGQSI